jgi:hypothetical protein
VEVVLNGNAVNRQPVTEEDDTIHPLFREPRRTVPMELQGGANSLLVLTKPAQDGNLRWFFEGSMTTPEGEVMVDLSYRLPVEQPAVTAGT